MVARLLRVAVFVAAQIAQVALWLIDHQMNQLVSEEFGTYFARIPLRSTPHVVNRNALRTEWSDVLSPENCSFVLGNPPFVGAMVTGDEQRADVELVFKDVKGSGVLDYVSAWYWKAARYIQGTGIRVGFVSTNSITQGEQVGILWAPLMTRLGVRIHFAHQTFRWSNEARGVAAVHCVIIGFASAEPAKRTIFEYADVAGEPHAAAAANINAYLIDAPDTFLVNRDAPISDAPPMRYGSMPRDDGGLILSADDRKQLLDETPEALPYVRLFLGAHEFLNGLERHCLWLVGAPPQLISRSRFLQERIRRVKEFRERSKAASTRAFAATPSLFCQIAQPEGSYVLVPRHSSENRRFIPMGFMGQENIVADSCLCIPDATLFHYGVMTSTMHMAWARFTCGRLKSDFRYSKDIVYNNFPWPEPVSSEQRERIEAAAEAVLAVRGTFKDSTLADLYDAVAMPPELVKAHQKLDAVVDAAYGRKTFRNDAERVAYLFELYGQRTSLLPGTSRPKRRAPRA